jgi:predicted RNase H-like HicB family nuclease
MKTISVLIEYDPETKTYGATSPDLQDVYAVGETRDDVLDRFATSATEYLAYLRERNEPLPALAIRHEVVTIALPTAS